MTHSRFSKILLILFSLGFLLTCLLGLLWAQMPGKRIPLPEDLQIENALAISRLYGLSREQAIILCGIYDHEKTPRKFMATFGYFGIRKSDHPVIEHCKSDNMLFLICAGLCAETIKLRCPDDSQKSVLRLGLGYGKGKTRYLGYATDPNWAYKVLRKAKKYEKILYE
jgi:hypothetical protein